MIPVNSCKKCVWFISGQKCLAFPDEIPEKIWLKGDKHTKKAKGDNGIQFEAIDDRQD